MTSPRALAAVTPRRTAKAAIDFLCGVAAVVAAVSADRGVTVDNVGDVAAMALAVGAILVLGFATAGSYRAVWRYTGMRDVLAIGTSGVGVLVSLVLARELGLMSLSAATIVLTTLLSLFFSVSVRTLRRWQRVVGLRHARAQDTGGSSELPPHRVLVAGAGEVGLRVGRDIVETAPRNVKLVGFLDDDKSKQGATLNGAPVLGRLEDLLTVADEYQVSELVVAMPSADPKVLRALVRRAEDVGVRVHAVPGLAHFVMGRELFRPGNATLAELLERSYGTVPANGNGNGHNGNGNGHNGNGNGSNGNGNGHHHNGNNGNGAGHIRGGNGIVVAYEHNGNGANGSRNGVRKVLVTGGAGYIGSHLTGLLLDRGYHVRILDRFDYGRAGIESVASHPRLEIVRGDICDSRVLLQAMRGVDGVIALAAIVGDPACNLDPEETINRNYMATKLLVEACNLYGVRRLVFASSCSVYGASDTGMLTERSRLNPVSLYARTRVLSENYILDRPGNVEPVVLRLSTVFGLSPRMRFDLVVNTLTVRAVVDKQISVFGGDSWRPNVHCRDAARAFLTAFEAPAAAVAGEIFNVGGDSLNHRIKDIATMVLSVVEGAQAVIQDEVVDPRNYRVSFEKIRTRLGFEPEFQVIDGIREITAAVRSNPALQRHQEAVFSNVQALKASFAEIAPAREFVAVS